MSDDISITVQAACDFLIDNGYDRTVAMRINDDGTITLHDRETYINAALAAARPRHEHEKWQIRDEGDGPYCAACGEKITT